MWPTLGNPDHAFTTPSPLNRHGQCALAHAGRCPKVHDPAKVAVCTRWLLGRCDGKACRLQHRVAPELMPACTFFLQVGFPGV
jgi:hypothetical protein